MRAGERTSLHWRVKANTVEQFEQIAHTRWAQSLFAFVIAFIIWRVIDAGITRFFARRFVSKFIPRVATYASLTKSLSTVVIAFALVLTLLSIWNINVVPALWSAGVLSIVLGLGAQATVRDLLAGLFFLVEDTFDVGDGVDLTTSVGQISGTVEAITLRETRVVDVRGSIVSVPNGNILFVANTTRLPSRVRLTITVPLRSGVVELREHVTQIARRAAQSTDAQVDHIAVHLDEVTPESAAFAISFHVSRQQAAGASSYLRESIATALQNEGLLPGVNGDVDGALPEPHSIPKLS